MSRPHADNAPVLLCFDGSPGAIRAIGQAGELLAGGRSAVVAHAWKPLMSAAFRYGPIEMTEALREAAAELDGAGGEQAASIAAEGAEVARRAGFSDVTTEVTTAAESIWGELLAVARRIDARLVVVGATGHRALSGIGIGSVARRLVDHADRPVLVVPVEPRP